MLNNSNNNWLQAAKKTIRTEFGRYRSVGFVLNNVRHNQYAVELITSIHDAVMIDPYNSYSLYGIRINELPDILPPCGFFNSFELQHHYGPLVVNDPWTWVAARGAICADIYYYVYDINMLKVLKEPDLIQLRNNKIISRNKHYTQTLKTLGLVPMAEIETPNASKFMEIIGG
jgi:hypothetical protein